jgi:hypothetical protein
VERQWRQTATFKPLLKAGEQHPFIAKLVFDADGVKQLRLILAVYRSHNNPQTDTAPAVVAPAQTPSAPDAATCEAAASPQ